MNTSTYFAAKQLWADGMSCKGIADLLGITKTQIMNTAYHHRDDFPARRKSARITPEQHQRILELHAKGMPYNQIAAKVGCHQNTVGTIIRRHKQ